jgi:YacP-like NYN domain
VIYSRQGEKADAVIMRVAREKSAGAVVVSSDREIRNAVERSGAVTISADEFNQILHSLDRRDWLEDDILLNSRPAKKGNPSRVSKVEHRRNEKLKKLTEYGPHVLLPSRRQVNSGRASTCKKQSVIFCLLDPTQESVIEDQHRSIWIKPVLFGDFGQPT